MLKFVQLDLIYMTQMLWYLDCYLNDWQAEGTEVSADGTEIALDRTAFYPESGGQPADEGRMVCNDKGYAVLSSKKEGHRVVHKVDRAGLSVGNIVSCSVDWSRRYTLMRYHTACHILSRVIFNETDAMVTGKQIYIDRARIDFSLKDFDKEKINSYEEKANEAVKKGFDVRWLIMPREEANKIENLVRLQHRPLPDAMHEVRVVDITGFDVQACGGTHVKNTKEIGSIVITKAENKGKENRRVEFVLE